MHEIIIRITPEQVQGVMAVAAMGVAVFFIGLIAITDLSRKVRELEAANADLRRRLLTAETVGQTQAQALETVDAMARATRRWS